MECTSWIIIKFWSTTIEKKADITVVCKNMDEGTDVTRFGCVKLNEDRRIIDFEEKPMTSDATTISCGIYVVRRRQLIELLERCAAEDRYDFVKDILVRYKNLKRIYAYKMEGYWSNIATVDSYYKTNMDFLKPEVRDYFFKQYPDIYTKIDDLPPAKYNPGATVKKQPDFQRLHLKRCGRKFYLVQEGICGE